MVGAEKGRCMKLNAKDIAAGLFLILLAVVGLWLNQDHSLGTARRMGPGYMPMLVFWIQIGLGVLVLGLGFGWFLRDRAAVVDANRQAVRVSLWLLLAVMGANFEAASIKTGLGAVEILGSAEGWASASGVSAPHIRRDSRKAVRMV